MLDFSDFADIDRPQVNISGELARLILLQDERRSPAWIANKCGCSMREVLDVLKNETALRDKLDMPLDREIVIPQKKVRDKSSWRRKVSEETQSKVAEMAIVEGVARTAKIFNVSENTVRRYLQESR